jgi:hypothetical protein
MGLSDFIKEGKERDAQEREVQKPSGFQTPIDYLEGFGQSAFEGMLEVFGQRPSVETERFRRENPVSGVVSEIAGFGVPYAGYFKATRIPKIASKIQKIGNASQAPVKTALLRETARFVPFELSRIGVSAVTGGDTEDVIAEAALDLGLFGGLSAVGALVKSGGKAAVNTAAKIRGVDLKAPIQIQMRQINNSIAMGEVREAELADALRALKDMGRAVRAENLGEIGVKGGKLQGKYVDKLELGGSGKELNRKFRVSSRGKGERRRRLLQSTNDFPGQAAIASVVKKAGLPADYEMFVQFPRVVDFKVKRAAQNMHNTMLKNMESLGGRWFWAKEANEGLFVMGKKIQGRADRASGADEWLVFKTDAPGRFVPNRKMWANRVLNVSEKLQPTKNKPFTPVGSPIYDQLGEMMGQIPMVAYIDDALRRGKPQEFADRVIKATGLGNIADKELVQRTKSFIREYFGPTQFQFGSSPRAKWLWGMARAAFSHAEARSEAILFGSRQTSRTGSLWRDIIGRTKTGGGVVNALDDLDNEDLFGVWRVWSEAVGIEDAKQMGLSSRAVNFLEKLAEIDTSEIEALRAVQGAVGAKLLKPKINHYGLSRVWRGDNRVAVMDENGRLIAVASGKTQGQATAEAQAIINEAKNEGRNFTSGTPFLADRSQDLELASKIAFQSAEFKLAAGIQTNLRTRVHGLKTFEERAGVAGFVGQKAPFTKEELRDILVSSTTGRQKYIAEQSFRELAQSQMDVLAAEDFRSFKILSDRINDLSGKPGPISQAINGAVDRLLGPVLGKNSASKIVSVTNGLMFHWMLGVGNLGFVAVNSLTFLQTTLPHIAYTMSATPGRLSRYYTWLPAAGADGAPRGAMGVVEPLKILRQSFREMSKPGERLRTNFERAAKEGVWDPRFVEEFAGQQASQIVNLRDAMKKGGMVQWMKAASAAGPGVSEKFARGHSFVTGHILARDFLKMSDPDQIYRFAKEFTENTQFLYSTADRARAITGPLGSLFGLFKNWQMHYMGWMLEYTGEGALRNNWAPLLWQTGGTFAAAGAGGLPLFAAADAASKWLSDESLMKNTYDMFGASGEDFASASDAVMLGLPAFFGVSLQGSAAAPFADPTRDASMLTSFVHLDRMKMLGRAAGTAIDNWSATGRHPVDSRQVRDQFIRALAPKTVYRLNAAWGEEYLRSLNTGYPQISGLTTTERLLYSAGLNPRRIELNFKVNDELWNDQNALREKTSELGKAFAVAQTERDSKEMSRLLQVAIIDGVDVASMLRSSQTILAKGREDMIERQFDPIAVHRFKDVLR